MIFKERIRSIRDQDRVLDIGPGAFPHPRADVTLERRFENPVEQLAQNGNEPSATINGSLVYYDGRDFPFEDDAFDYVICSHVIEHVPDDELDHFVQEVQRVGKRGYLEFPLVYYEFLCFTPVHRWFMNYRDDEILLLDKAIFKSNPLHQCFRELMHGDDFYRKRMFHQYRDYFFYGFEWDENIRFRRVSTFEELVNENDLAQVCRYFAERGHRNRAMSHRMADRLSTVTMRASNIPIRACRKALRLCGLWPKPLPTPYRSTNPSRPAEKSDYRLAA